MTNLSSQDSFGLFSFTVAVLVLIIGCGASIRDPGVYGAELDFIDVATEDVVRNGEAMIAAECECVEDGGTLRFGTLQCAELSETLVVLKARMKHHTAFMRFLGGINEERPTEEPPIIPDATTLCPQNDGGIGGTGDVDGGAK